MNRKSKGQMESCEKEVSLGLFRMAALRIGPTKSQKVKRVTGLGGLGHADWFI